MAVDPTSPVTVVEGIAQARARALATIRVFNVFDLLRATVSQLHQAVSASASEDEVGSWQNMAALLQVEHVTPQWAEALDAAGVGSIEELSTKKLDELQALFSTARDNHLIPDVPTPNQIADMIRDAAVIGLSGALTLTVQDRDGNPVAGATARIGPSAAQTDARGRVRLLRIPLGAALPLVLEHPDHGLLLLEEPPVIPDHQVIGVTVLTMPQRGTAEDASMVQLSEYDGDTLPLGANIPTRQVTLAADSLREGDLLSVCSLFKSEPCATLVSMLKSCAKGEIMVYHYRVPLSAFDAPPQVGDLYVRRGGKFIPRKRTVDHIHHYKIRRKLAGAFAGRPAPSTIAEKMRDMEERIKWLAENGGLAGHARWDA